MMSENSRSVLETLLPSGAHPDLPGLFETGFDDFYREFEETAVFQMRLGFKAALFIAAWVSPLLIWKLPPLARLDADSRERALEALGGSRFYFLRQMMLLLKAVSSFGYGADRSVRDAVGFPKR